MASSWESSLGTRRQRRLGNLSRVFFDYHNASDESVPPDEKVGSLGSAVGPLPTHTSLLTPPELYQILFKRMSRSFVNVVLVFTGMGTDRKY
ncbi:hypothetical protein R1flu_006692 [Riccia fluitans]|uniref:Uncharacterized protein n=1 Tax=Riccia fluitans TaxID=41844 RepID=A0ABD1YXH0_9MARC